MNWGHWDYWSDKNKVPDTCLEGHAWQNTGTRRTWCKVCDCDGELDPVTGIVAIVTRPNPGPQEVP